MKQHFMSENLPFSLLSVGCLLASLGIRNISGAALKHGINFCVNSAQRAPPIMPCDLSPDRVWRPTRRSGEVV
jgi:hypothetical protein